MFKIPPKQQPPILYPYSHEELTAIFDSASQPGKPGYSLQRLECGMKPQAKIDFLGVDEKFAYCRLSGFAPINILHPLNIIQVFSLAQSQTQMDPTVNAETARAILPPHINATRIAFAHASILALNSQLPENARMHLLAMAGEMSGALVYEACPEEAITTIGLYQAQDRDLAARLPQPRPNRENFLIPALLDALTKCVTDANNLLIISLSDHPQDVNPLTNEPYTIEDWRGKIEEIFSHAFRAKKLSVRPTIIIVTYQLDFTKNDNTRDMLSAVIAQGHADSGIINTHDGEQFYQQILNLSRYANVYLRRYALPYETKTKEKKQLEVALYPNEPFPDDTVMQIPLAECAPSFEANELQINFFGVDADLQPVIIDLTKNIDPSLLSQATIQQIKIGFTKKLFDPRCSEAVLNCFRNWLVMELTSLTDPIASQYLLAVLAGNYTKAKLLPLEATSHKEREQKTKGATPPGTTSYVGMLASMQPQTARDWAIAEVEALTHPASQSHRIARDKLAALTIQIKSQPSTPEPEQTTAPGASARVTRASAQTTQASVVAVDVDVKTEWVSSLIKLSQLVMQIPQDAITLKFNELKQKKPKDAERWYENNPEPIRAMLQREYMESLIKQHIKKIENSIHLLSEIQDQLRIDHIYKIAAMPVLDMKTSHLDQLNSLYMIDDILSASIANFYRQHPRPFMPTQPPKSQPQQTHFQLEAAHRDDDSEQKTPPFRNRC
jgi:hypothetical protein